MSHSAVLKLSALVMGLFGIALLIDPNAVLAAYEGKELNTPGVYNSMLYGSVLLAVAFMNWMASRVDAREARILVAGNLLGNVLGLGVALYQQLAVPEVPPLAWFNVLLFLLFALLYGRLHFRGPEATAQHAPA